MNNKIIKTKIKYYKFDISDKEQKKKYLILCNKIKKIGIKKDTSHFINFSYESNQKFMNKIKKMEKMGFIEIETENIFSNQWNTSEKSFNLRIWDWSENIFKNGDIKEGYFLTDMTELFKLREETYKCGYCGEYYTKKQKENENITFCYKCLDSEFLTEDNLSLLRLKRINDETDRGDLNDCDKEALLKSYYEIQKIARKRRLSKKIFNKRKSLKEDLEKSKDEYFGFMWLINQNINFENVIYYGHSKTFCFGWRYKLSFEEEQKLKKSLSDFPYKYELRT